MNARQLAIDKFDKNSEDGSHLHWKLYYGYDARAQSNLVATSGTIKDFNKESSRQHLDWTLKTLDAGQYLVQYKNEVNDTNNIISYRFEIPFGNQSTEQISGSGNVRPVVNQAYSKEDIQEQIKLHLDKAQANWERGRLLEEMTEMRKEMKALEQKAQGNNFGAAINGMKEIFVMLQNKTAPVNTAKISIAKGGNIPTEDAEAQQYYTNLYNEVMAKMIARADNNPYLNIELLYALNRWIEENPDMYQNVILPQLLPYQKELQNRE